jgi:predicted outer membrane repeat protein
VANSCSLRDALAAATTDGDIIVFDSALSGQTILLQGDQLKITAGITITGLGSANLTVQLQNYDGSTGRVFYIDDTATTGVEVVMSGLSIINGDAQGGNGGGIYDNHDGDLTLTDVSITGCTALFGGAIYKNGDGTMEIIDSTISDNYADQSAGALVNNGVGDLVITNSTFDSNTALYDGGVGKIGNGGNVTITGSTFSNNTSGSFYEDEDGDTYYTSGKGGAIYITSGVTGNVLISGSTFSDNQTSYDGGGAIYAYNGGSFAVTSSTFSGNTAYEGGGAIFAYNGGSFAVTSSTFSGNTAYEGGGAIFAYNGGSFTI